MMKKSERVFNYFDKNKDGKLTPLELHRCIGSICGDLSLEAVQLVVAPLISSENGVLGMDELECLVESDNEEERMEDLKKTFRMYEMEGNECITPRSLKRMLSIMGESRSVDECVGMIDRFDLNGDGVLSFDEFKIMMLS
ncbi:calcium-binding CML38-like [Olea europaea subsp. europaea]|uniref:Calcium-binding CML38-like n=1 Tax=Olea europaea subsp. europaea TaxID=158383 RepID=A0A8S0QHZ3_OLEEU|nr:calcium-binding CML38-like [Olea europaea subsp. europaea]